jgi:hypothetical protein
MVNMQTTLQTGKIGIEIEMKNITPKEVLTLRDYFLQLAQLNIHRFKNGKLIMHFDEKGLNIIDVKKRVWKRKKSYKVNNT